MSYKLAKRFAELVGRATDCADELEKRNTRRDDERGHEMESGYHSPDAVLAVEAFRCELEKFEEELFAEDPIAFNLYNVRVMGGIKV